MAQVETETLRRWQEVVEQAWACISGETPEDCSHEEAEEDTLAKLRDVDREITDALAKKD